MLRWPEWTGLSEKRWTTAPNEEVRPAKTLWDWLQLIAVPLALAVLAVLFNEWQSERDARREERSAIRERAIARDARLDAVLQTYITQLSNLVLDHQLLTSGETSDVRVIARTLTLAAVRRLDGRRKGEVVRYLDDAGLIASDAGGAEGPIIFLGDADLRRADLRDARSQGLSFAGADLRGARFDRADILFTDFAGSRLQEARFVSAFVAHTSFERARLDGAVFAGAGFYATAVGKLPPGWSQSTRFKGACLSGATFYRAEVDAATLADAVGLHVDFAEARLSPRVLAGAELKRTNVAKADVRGGLPPDWNDTGIKGDISRSLEFVCDPDGLSHG
jgi:uncharacterized protein YjbI with pentapeptide repeats